MNRLKTLIWASCMFAAAVIGCVPDAAPPEPSEATTADITVPTGTSNKQAVGLLLVRSNGDFAKKCTAALIKLDVDAFKDNKFPKNIDDDTTIPNWVLTAAHCVDPAESYGLYLPNVCVDNMGKAANCARDTDPRMMIRFSGANCFTAGPDKSEKVSDTALCLITKDLCSPASLKTIAWTLPSLAAARYEGGTDVDVHGFRHAVGVMPSFRTYPGWPGDPEFLSQNPGDRNGKIWTASRPAKKTKGLVVSVAKQFKLKAAGGGGNEIDVDNSEGTLDHGDSGGPAYKDSSTIVGTNHTTSRKIYLADPNKGADCHAERANPTTPATPVSTALIAQCKQTTRIINSHITVAWEPMAKQIIAGTWTGLGMVDDPADGEDQALDETMRRFTVAEDNGGVLLDYRVINEICMPDPTPTPTPFPTPSPTPDPTPSPTPFPTPFPTPTPTATPFPTPSPTPFPTPSPTPFPTPFPTPSPTPGPTPFPTPMPTPIIAVAPR